MTPQEIEQFQNWGAPLPTRDPHSEDTYENPLSAKLKNVNPRNWRQEGNQLICDTDVGELGQSIPTDNLLVGIDNNGLPIFKKIEC